MKVIFNDGGRAAAGYKSHRSHVLSYERFRSRFRSNECGKEFGSIKVSSISELFKRPGVPERIRTSDLRFRKPLLYPAELRGLVLPGQGVIAPIRFQTNAGF